MKKILRNQKRDYLREFLKVAPLSHALWRAVEALAFAKIKIPRDSLDIGCGFGEFAGVVFNQFEVGIDINGRDLSEAVRSGKYRKVKLADSGKLPFPNNSFSLIVSVSVLEHIKNPEKVLKEIARVTKKGGTFVFSVPTTGLYNNLLGRKFFQKLGLGAIADSYCHLHQKIFHHESIFPSGWWEKKIKSSGFSLIEKTGTISSLVANLHEIFLLSALPSQLWKIATGHRLIIFQLRAKLFPLIFGRFVKLDPQSTINMFYMAKKL